MPPRIPITSVASSTTALVHSAVRSDSSTVATVAARCVSRQSKSWTPQSSASFSTTSRRTGLSKPRKLFLRWLRGPGARFEKPREGGTNYMVTKESPFGAKDVPFPLNGQFRSYPVLDNQAREVIWNKVMRKGEPIKAVSAELGVDIPRVAAIVRLKEVEKDWVAKGKKLALPYSKAVLAMLPTRTVIPDAQNKPFEPINELHIHHSTMKQLFWPTSESRHFTRYDAAKAFHRKMLPADDRVPHPELIQMERDLLEGKSPSEAKARFQAAAEKSEREAAEAQMKKTLAEEAATTRVNTKRFEFRFKEVDSEDVGKNGRKIGAVGWKYGMPSYDRMKGRIRIPTSVP